MTQIGYYGPTPGQPGGFAGSAPFDPTGGWVMVDLPCRKCGANLRGLHATQRCPQCGTPAGVTTQGELLGYAPPPWLAGVRTGLLTVVYSSVGLAVAIVAAFIAIFFLAFQAGMKAAARGPGGPAVNPAESEEIRQGTMIFLIVAVVGGMAIAIGTWAMSAPDPSGAGEPQVGGVRKVLRATIALSVILSVVYAVFAAAVGFVEVQHGTAGVALALVGYLVQAAMSVAEGLYLAHLAGRVPEPALAGRMKLSGWTVGVCLALMGVLGAAAQAAFGDEVRRGNGGLNTGSAGPLMAIGCVNGLAGLTLIVFAVIMVVGVGQLARRFREARQYALAVYGAGPGGPTQPPPGGPIAMSPPPASAPPQAGYGYPPQG